jgi:hypothetical protein
MHDAWFSTYALPYCDRPEKKEGSKTEMTLNHNLSLAPLVLP